MRITVNGDPHDLPDASTVADLVGSLDLPETGVAVAVDGDVVPASGWGGAPLHDGAEVDVLTAVQGG